MLFIKEPDSNEYDFYPEEFVREALVEKIHRGDNPRKYEDGECLAIGGITPKGVLMAQMMSMGEFNSVEVSLTDASREVCPIATVEVPEEDINDQTAERWGIEGVDTHEPRIYIFEDGDCNSHLIYFADGGVCVAEASDCLY